MIVDLSQGDLKTFAACPSEFPYFDKLTSSIDDVRLRSVLAALGNLSDAKGIISEMASLSGFNSPHNREGD